MAQTELVESMTPSSGGRRAPIYRQARGIICARRGPDIAAIRWTPCLSPTHTDVELLRASSEKGISHRTGPHHYDRVDQTAQQWHTPRAR